MPAYINNKGEILAEAPLHHQVSEFFLNLYLALIFFFQTLINPAGNHKLPPTSSLKARQTMRASGGAANGRGSGSSGRGGGGGSGSMSDFSGPVSNAPIGGGCCGR